MAGSHVPKQCRSCGSFCGGGYGKKFCQNTAFAGKTHFADSDTLEYIAKLEADKKRLDFLESLRNRPVDVFKKNPVYFHGSGLSALYSISRDFSVEFAARGHSVREMIDDAIKNHEAKE